MSASLHPKPKEVPLIEISRSLARQVRSVVRKSIVNSRRDPSLAVLFRADRSGLVIRAGNADVVVEYRQAGSPAPDELMLPLAALADFEGRNDNTVRFERKQDGVHVSWN